MALQGVEHTVMTRLSNVGAPLSWAQWMRTMKGIPGMKSGECREHYTALKFGEDWEQAAPARREIAGSAPPDAKRVWRSPLREPQPRGIRASARGDC